MPTRKTTASGRTRVFLLLLSSSGRSLQEKWPAEQRRGSNNYHIPGTALRDGGPLIPRYAVVGITDYVACRLAFQ